MYYVPLVGLIILAIIEKRYNWKYAYYIGIAGLTLMLCLRFGQGTDYFAYFRAYYVGDYHSEVGYQLICKLFQLCKIRYEVLNAAIGLATMYCLDKAIRRYSTWRTFSLLLVYPTIFLTYFFSAIRQGFIIAFFLGFMLQWLEEGKWRRYLLASIILMTIHISAVFFLPVVIIKDISFKKLYWLVAIAVGCGVVLNFIPKGLLEIPGLGRISYYLSYRKLSVLGLAERCSMLLVIGLLFKVNNREITESKSIQLMYKLYLFGFTVSVFFMPWTLLSSRIPAALKAVEILLIPILLYANKGIQKALATVLILYVVVMTTKNLYSYIQQSITYYEGYNPVTYPYINLINKGKYGDIWKNNEYYQNYIYYRDCAKKLTF